MGNRGPSRTPTKVLAARGSWRAATRHGEPQADGVPVAPDWLKGDALAAWNALLPRLTNMGVVGAADTNALSRYCTLLARWRACEAFIAKYGQTTDDGREYPQVARASKLADQLLRLEQNFGLTPSARRGVSPGPTQQAAAPPGIAQFLRRGGA